mmetsp:Transcript_1373/g.5564  ORF Transcript_1373/g.5564 Transcript_1373/m.5564 type:complete len:242 (-) Transcript_1373:683-1408(-)
MAAAAAVARRLRGARRPPGADATRRRRGRRPRRRPEGGGLGGAGGHLTGGRERGAPGTRWQAVGRPRRPFCTVCVIALGAAAPGATPVYRARPRRCWSERGVRCAKMVSTSAPSLLHTLVLPSVLAGPHLLRGEGGARTRNGSETTTRKRSVILFYRGHQPRPTFGHHATQIRLLRRRGAGGHKVGGGGVARSIPGAGSARAMVVVLGQQGRVGGGASVADAREARLDLRLRLCTPILNVE